MNPITLGIGCLALGYGIFTAVWRVIHPEKFKKLEAMKRQWGEKGGMAVHVIGYTLLPVVVGLGMMYGGYRGVSLF